MNLTSRESALIAYALHSLNIKDHADAFIDLSQTEVNDLAQKVVTKFQEVSR